MGKSAVRPCPAGAFSSLRQTTRLRCGCPAVHGRRIFVVEDDDALYLRLYDALRSAGGEVIGSLTNFPDLGPMVPPIRIDAALIDVDGWNSSLSELARDLKIRSIPTL